METATVVNNSTSTEPIVCTESTPEQLMHAIQHCKPISGITTLVTHPAAHSDEFLEMYFQKCTPEGKKMFPGIEESDCDFWTQKELVHYQGDEGFYRALQKGCFIFGTNKGPFDEHGEREERKSCAQVMCEYLGLKNTKEGRIIYSNILNYVNFEDRKGNNLRNHFKNPDFAGIISSALFADNIKKGWKLVDAGIKDVNDLISDVMGFIENEVESQRLFVQNIAEFENIKKKVIPLPSLKRAGDKKNPILLIIQTDNDEMTAVAKNQFSKNQNDQLRVLVKINSKGQFYICPMNGTTLIEVVKLLRITLVRNRKLPLLKYDVLKSDGSIPGIDEIYYHTDSDSIMNGSKTQRDVPGLINCENGIIKADFIKAVIDGVRNK